MTRSSKLPEEEEKEAEPNAHLSRTQMQQHYAKQAQTKPPDYGQKVELRHEILNPNMQYADQTEYEHRVNVAMSQYMSQQDLRQTQRQNEARRLMKQQPQMLSPLGGPSDQHLTNRHGESNRAPQQNKLPVKPTLGAHNRNDSRKDSLRSASKTGQDGGASRQSTLNFANQAA